MVIIPDHMREAAELSVASAECPRKPVTFHPRSSCLGCFNIKLAWQAKPR
jgi:hypothetical protein